MIDVHLAVHADCERGDAQTGKTELVMPCSAHVMLDVSLTGLDLHREKKERARRRLP